MASVFMFYNTQILWLEMYKESQGFIIKKRLYGTNLPTGNDMQTSKSINYIKYVKSFLKGNYLNI